ncbi:23S rRNA (adenine(2503)-C(2))-methyltransferase RlmN [Pelotomaculum terephthalicicum JT]|uniref:23S rRNA (adenine(2503)-C(2))-methyltransferase RlmN n=1 Tax=Pelotomaculum TaxID=191373 RepID=UPI0009D10D54|nr:MULTISPECIES: 23S rRNA (adenine(2503)-C(2))-methyltransferase RlmN [Pelotomaculum]MCG9968469.1 23S rRNA (adenine(2503)-C(2))-methyltransferase RlmN [Pelotomaculum terephthalicicum JT]OPX88893.1 MAG: putative dual-specificity RNA methyltransferase RlmN [Pelotomaculum sp. PtaB.Bin117]OPY60222.1 MAG: putative dual-specificity RNA methyltransferase RlmN [Pelotomaculum sp. PtaU1.Bin065]
MSVKIDLRDLTLSELVGLTRQMDVETYRARQMAEWVFQKGAGSLEEMTNLPRDMRGRLASIAGIGRVEVIKRQVSRGGDTVKYLFKLDDGQAVESVLMKHSYGNSACISTQAGCRMGCRLCASSLGGFVRNLRSGEIYGQVLGMQKDAGERVSHVVIMGSGEPLDNYAATLAFIKNVTAPYGLNIGQRHITVSTCGLAPRIREMAGEKLAVTLAVSLHAPNDHLRDELMPVNKKYPLRVLMEACREYALKTGRRITFEYALIAGLNDGHELAAELGALLSDMLCHVNLILANPVPERGVRPSARRQALIFKNILEKMGIPVTVRRSLGGDIDAACGQLRQKTLAGWHDACLQGDFEA